MEKEVKVNRLDAAKAAALMALAGLDDPARRATPESIAESGDCYKLTVGESVGVFVLEKNGSNIWISGAGAVASRGLAAVGFPVIEALARQSRCERVAFQTGRPGLVKLAKKQGYRIRGFIMEKAV